MLVIENAPALEVVLVEIGEYPPYLHGATGPRIEKAKKIVRTCRVQYSRRMSCLKLKSKKPPSKSEACILLLVSV